MKISIEGNIGGGKSTVLQRISMRTRMPIFLEPVETEWKEGLKLFYQDNARWGFTFNMNVLNTYNKWKNNEFTAIYERSPLSCRHVFLQLQYESGGLTEYEKTLFEEFFPKLAWEPDFIIYIHTSPEVCMQRMQSRARACEDNVPLKYLQQIDEKYEEMIAQLSKQNKKVYIVDGNKDVEQVYQSVMGIVDALV